MAKKVIYISGPITGRPDYMRDFNKMETQLTVRGFIPLNPAHLPKGMRNGQYMRICMAMIDAADAVVLLPDWQNSFGAKLEADYCNYTGKPAYLSLEGLLEKEGEPNA